MMNEDKATHVASTVAFTMTGEMAVEAFRKTCLNYEEGDRCYLHNNGCNEKCGRVKDFIKKLEEVSIKISDAK